MPGFGDGLRAAQITDAVLASAASQAWVDAAVDGAGVSATTGAVAR